MMLLLIWLWSTGDVLHIGNAGLGNRWARERKVAKVNHQAPSCMSLLDAYFDEITLLQHF